jgi:hypothetical protein
MRLFYLSFCSSFHLQSVGGKIKQLHSYLDTLKIDHPDGWLYKLYLNKKLGTYNRSTRTLRTERSSASINAPFPNKGTKREEPTT